MKKIISILTITIAVLPFSALAQTTPDIVDTIPTPDASVSQPDPIVVDTALSPGDIQVTGPAWDSISPQDTGTDQQTAGGSVIEPTFDPNQTGTSTPIDVVPPAMTDPDPTPIPSQPNIPDVVTITDVVSETASVSILVAPGEVASPVASITTEDLAPKDKYVFKLEGPATATKDDPKSQKQISITPTLVPDDVSGELDISGSCSEPYFVVLLYKDKEDYNKNPASYIFNKAFDCLNGSYKYSIDQIPSNLPDGTYYLLIGGQGKLGTWKPITALTPITIQKTDNDN